MKMQDESDPYWKLRPEWATPEDEICQCVDHPPIVLQDHLSSLPLACLKCNGEVPPERLGFDAKLAECIAFWRNLHRALYTLWLASGDYEDWGRAQLQDPEGQVNRKGIEIVEELNVHHRAYYWWFEDNSIESFVPPSNCPRCSGTLLARYGCSVCEACSIMVHGRD
jgi:hypothetical protein